MHLKSKLAQSATLMSWGNLAAKSATLIVVTPLALAKLPQADAALFLLASNILGLMLVMDMGFSSTFTRLFAFANGGAPISKLEPNFNSDTTAITHESATNTETLRTLEETARLIYACLAVGTVIIIAAFASSAMLKVARESSEPPHAIAACVMLIATLPGNILQIKYAAIVQGLGQVARWQRLQMWFSLASAASAVIVLLSTPAIYLVIICIQGIAVVNTIVSRRIVRKLLASRYGTAVSNKSPSQSDIRAAWKIIWPQSWRSGVGILFSAGIVQGSGVVATHLSDVAQAGSYLLALQLIRGVNMFALSPFYARLPEFATFYAQSKKPQLLALAKRSMQRSYAVFLIGWIGLGLIGTQAFNLIDASLTFPPEALWTILGLAFLAERYGAMHIQLYSLSHRIIWHIANGATGTLMLLLAFLLHEDLGTIGLALAMLLANLGCYCWYAARYSYRLYKLKWWEFETACAIPAFLMAAGYSAFTYFRA